MKFFRLILSRLLSWRAAPYAVALLGLLATAGLVFEVASNDKAHLAQRFQLLAHTGLGSAHAGEVAGGLHAFLQDFLHGVEGTLLGGTAGTVGDRAELGLAGIEFLAHRAQFLCAFGCLGGEEFKADGWRGHGVSPFTKNGLFIRPCGRG